ncbi:MAG TPA: aminomethyl-transferring glycine dehydrogenase [Acidimicrobiales bacterium]|nr:aminomethyl-transferring glycine dehydrogenase [Acidimicrobiales bacterium]
MTRPLPAAERPALTFADRHLGPDADDLAEMLAAVGVSSLDELLDRVVPDAIRDRAPLALPTPVSEGEALAELRALAAQNRPLRALIGMGYAATVTPGVIRRNVLESPAWYTAYTPYQPEISQGRLEALLNFQTMVSDLTAMDVANASLLDEATAAAEALTMMRRVGRHPASRCFVDAGCHPQVIDVVRTRAEPLGIELVVGDPGRDLVPDEVFGAILAHPATDGRVRDLRATIDAVHVAGGLVTVATDLLACCVVVPPGEMGADVVVGSSQRFGVPMGYGGPHAAFMAVREPLVRALPGRLVGVSVDAAGRPALRLALQTREQHIRREKATSNICTAQVLLAVVAGFYGAYHGPDGLRAIARRVQGLTLGLRTLLVDAGFAVGAGPVFDTLTVEAPGRASALAARAVALGVNLRVVDGDRLGISLDEACDESVVATVVEALTGSRPDADQVEAVVASEDPTAALGPLARTSGYLDHPVFHEHRSETAMLRYLRRLSDRDLALDRTMIPLGSCTMKLNATAEMEPISWPAWADLHPFAPLDQAEGYRRLVADLEGWLAEITGYDAVSLQPNAGSQGEYAGLLAIRAYHRSRGDDQRVVCLIPSSAHGTNAASAVLAGMDVVVVACDERGDVDLVDLRAKVAEVGDRLAAVMVTYPSTHGVFEEGIVELCDVVHGAGGQVYLDGANLNALVGVARPGRFGADVSHLNLHKTFTIPHGGGGPGVGPVAVRAHLAPFLPGHGVVPEAGPRDAVGPVSAAPWGSAGILPIAWMYVRMMGDEGLRRATATAILAANYVAARLEPRFPVLYRGPGGFVAHECILDVRPARASAGVTVDDIAKRLIDHGFHAPTMSFPVAGTLMVEPTESEHRRELDRFCRAMEAIADEIDQIAAGALDRDDHPLRRAPHTAADLMTDSWDRAYARSLGAFPLGGELADRYFPPVGRIDAAHGDRHVVCSCPPIEAFA